MGSGAGGYVRITLTTLRRDYNEKTERLRRGRELALTGAPDANEERPQQDGLGATTEDEETLIEDESVDDVGTITFSGWQAARARNSRLRVPPPRRRPT